MAGPFKMKYKSSAFPFKSPLKQGIQHFDVTGDGVTPVDVETEKERVWRGHSPRGSVADILRRRKEKERREKEKKEATWGDIVEDIKATISKKEDKK